MTKYLVITLLLCTAPCRADVRLPKILGSNMVLQRESHVKIWGWADPGERVSVTCDWIKTKVETTTDANGEWLVRVKTGAAGGPHSIIITGKNKIVLKNILFGEVWIASGQSNMEMPLAHVSYAYKGIKDAKKEIAAAKYPEIRLFQVGNFSSKSPLDDVEPGVAVYNIPPAVCAWQACTPKTISNFSSTAYFFARTLHRELKVPIGIIDASWGGTMAEWWTPAAGLKALGYTTELEQAAKLPQKPDQKGVATRLYNGMIHPLHKFQIRGVVWYQGESNRKPADKYHALFSTMIGQWRDAFGYEFPFYFVQIAPCNWRENTAYLREAQLKTMSLTKTGMAVTMDIGDIKDGHPKNKQEVGRRLALWALAKDYGQKIVYSGPIYKRCTFRRGKAYIEFEHISGGLMTSDSKPPSHFLVAGADKVFHPANAIIRGGNVVVWASNVSNPKAVRYAFTSDAVPNLMNKKGLPASSFRTDNW